MGATIPEHKNQLLMFIFGCLLNFIKNKIKRPERQKAAVRPAQKDAPVGIIDF
jgi:hypothetical protein